MPDRPTVEHGSATVEFALLLPVLLLLMLALVQVGVLARDSLLLTQASRAGAREAAVQPSLQAVEGTVQATAMGLDAARLHINVTWGEARGSPVTVSLVYDAPTAALLVGWLFPENVSLSAHATMRREFA